VKLRLQSHDGRLSLTQTGGGFCVRITDEQTHDRTFDAVQVSLPKGLTPEQAEVFATHLDIALRSLWPQVSPS
jgi:Lon protease-like protein